VEFQQLRGFYFSARLGSLTKAAEKMAVTQSAVSQQVKALEEELGVKLFNRFGPNKELTPDGHLFLKLISPLIQDIDTLKATFEDMKGVQKGQLTIAATTFIIMNFIPGTIKHFIKKHPHIHLNILERRWTEIVHLTQSGEIDFGIAPVTDIPSNLYCIKLEPIERALITSINHPLAKKSNITLLDITQYPIITYEKGLVARDEVEKVFEQVQLDVEFIMETTNAETIKHYVEMGVGIAIIPSIAVRKFRGRRLAVRPVSQYFGRIQYGVLLRKGKHTTSWARAFLQILDPAIKESLKE
jgi:DNA-binding transcriptional LysR family regulator